MVNLMRQLWEGYLFDLIDSKYKVLRKLMEKSKFTVIDGLEFQIVFVDNGNFHWAKFFSSDIFYIDNIADGRSKRLLPRSCVKKSKF